MGVFNNDELSRDFWESHHFRGLGRSRRVYYRIITLNTGHIVNCRAIETDDHFVMEYSFCNKFQYRSEQFTFDIYDRGDLEVFLEKIRSMSKFEISGLISLNILGHGA